MCDFSVQVIFELI